MEHPIIMSGLMVRSIFSGIKTQTRRIINPRSAEDIALMVNMNAGINVEHSIAELIRTSCRYGEPGDILWVRETFSPVLKYQKGCPYDFKYWYAADDHSFFGNGDIGKPDTFFFDKWKPSIHMPREAARIFLKNKGVRIERVQDISKEDALAEGIERIYNTTSKVYKNYLFKDDVVDDPIESYHTLWEKLHGKESWKENPWVWVIDYKHKKNYVT